MVTPARVQFDAGPDGLEVTLEGTGASELPYVDLDLFHPTRKGRDLVARLPARGGGVFALTQALPEAANWHVSIRPPDGDWTLKGRMRLPEQTRALIE